MRSIHIAATALAAGTVCFALLVIGPASGVFTLARRWNVVIWIALGVAILSGVGWLLLLAADIYGAPIVEVCLHGGAWSALTDTRFGLV